MHDAVALNTVEPGASGERMGMVEIKDECRVGGDALRGLWTELVGLP